LHIITADAREPAYTTSSRPQALTAQDCRY
jgi:hypothetical protein